MFRIIRVPAALDDFFQPLEQRFHWNHFIYFRLLVVTIACMWGRRHVANLYAYLEAPSHRTRVNNFFLVERWDPEAVLRQNACYAAVCLAICSTGNAQVTMVPRPGAESIITDPPCNSTKDRTSESPRPGPRCCDPIESVSNQSNTLSIASGGIPGP